MLKLLVATENPGKQREYRQLLADLPVTLCFPVDLGLHLEVVEDGETFVANAGLKATAYSRASGLWSLADDSGLEVDALDGAPGVRSARYGGGLATDHARVEHLLLNLAGVETQQRTARFRCALVLSGPQGEERTTEGVCQGLILTAPRGTGGFGYDPVFLLPELGVTMAELSAQEKNRISHRAKAVEAMRPIVAELLGDGG